MVIIEYFALNPRKRNSEKEFVDLDEIISFENLIEFCELRTKNQLNCLFLKQFHLLKNLLDSTSLITTWIFSTWIANTMVDLLTGEVVFYSNTAIEILGKQKIMNIRNYVRKKYHGGLAMFMCVSGPNASDVVISCSDIYCLFNLDGFFVDQFAWKKQ